MRIMTYNIQHCRDYKNQLATKKEKINYEDVAKVIISQNADIVGLNEVRNKGKSRLYLNQTKILADLIGYKYYYFAEAIKFNGVNPYGNALISKYPIINAKTVYVPKPNTLLPIPRYETRCVLVAQIDVEGKILTVLSSHFGLSVLEEQNAVKTILNEIESIDTPFVVMGDFNLTPQDTILQPIQNALFDTSKIFDAPKLSFPSINPDRKIDYIFTSKKVKPVFADIPNCDQTDHRPCICDIEF